MYYYAYPNHQVVSFLKLLFYRVGLCFIVLFPWSDRKTNQFQSTKIWRETHYTLQILFCIPIVIERFGKMIEIHKLVAIVAYSIWITHLFWMKKLWLEFSWNFLFANFNYSIKIDLDKKNDFKYRFLRINQLTFALSYSC